MPSEFPQPASIRATVTVVSCDPPIACDVRLDRRDDGWRLEGRPDNGDPPFVAALSEPAGPILSWMAQAVSVSAACDH